MGTTGFYSHMLGLGVGFPIHPFFESIVESYEIAPSELTPFVWCQMMGIYLLWSDLGVVEPRLNVWHY